VLLEADGRKLLLDVLKLVGIGRRDIATCTGLTQSIAGVNKPGKKM
jgi:hypothetical protein